MATLSLHNPSGQARHPVPVNVPPEKWVDRGTNQDAQADDRCGDSDGEAPAPAALAVFVRWFTMAAHVRRSSSLTLSDACWMQVA